MSTGANMATTGAGDGSVEQQCVDTINAYRASMGLAPYQRWTSNESCTDGQAEADGTSMTAHSAFGAPASSSADLAVSLLTRGAGSEVHAGDLVYARIRVL